MSTLYLHIGTTKTGTTALQNFLSDNRDILNRKGYCYPSFPYHYKDVSDRRNAHFLIAGNPKDAIDTYQNGLCRLHHLFQQYPNIILSDEGIWTAECHGHLDIWEALLKDGQETGFTVRLMVYLRRQDQYLASGWNQTVKSGLGNGACKSWKDYAANKGLISKMKYGSHLKALSDIIGKENILVRRYEPDRFVSGSIYADFLQTVGLELTDEYRIPDGKPNQGLSGNTCEIMRILNGMPGMDASYHSFFRQALLLFSDISDKEYPCRMFSAEEARKFMNNYSEENQLVSEYFLGGEDLFHPDHTDIRQWEKDNPHMQDDIIRFIAACCFSLSKENEKLRQEIRSLPVPEKSSLLQRIFGNIDWRIK